ncbi:hypothetical protein [Undibacterium fentianense]|uniref:Uncharacterized protein n=1 Tax=Undibacterium fentianense TaxID=2828728 RepID=A0A941E1W3_9BURK|nr:hypothetical protein [Undibacterium fentianense]MBR7799542.1 hypothetical protein [Undibacterium fentianense]
MTQSPYRSLYTYAWDIADVGVTQFVDEVIAMGITDISLATAYHAGKFIRPHAKNPPRVIFPEDGVTYFNPDLTSYGDITPLAHSDATIREVLPALLKDGRVRVHGWTVLLHNTRLGTTFPQYTVKNAFGDPYVYSLCPMQDAVFDYAVNLSRDLCEQHRIHSIILETPGWQPYGHGYHHEFAQVASNAWLDNMLGMCFCNACKQAAKNKHIEIDALQQRVQATISNYLSLPANAQGDQAASWTQSDLLSDADLFAFISLRQDRVTQLVTAIKAAIPAACQLAVIPTVQRPTSACWTEGSDLRALAEVADYIEIPFYEPNAHRVIADAWECLRQIAHPNKVRAILRPGFPDLNHGADLHAAIRGIQAQGVQDFAFYNYGLLPQYQLDHLSDTLKEIE